MSRRDKSWESEEWDCIRERREVAFGLADTNSDKTERPKNLVGLALSGGGIRSAIYNDGFLQGLSHRGLLRYVDYLSSVSGGGYIAGHLIAQAKAKESTEAKAPNGDKKSTGDRVSREKETGFHDDATIPEGDNQSASTPKFKRWHLGRDPETGEIDTKRMAGIGGYLSRPGELLPAYLWSCFFSASFYLGVCGIIATLAAMLWRSFDDPTFRMLYREVLGIRAGDELLIAFIPFLILFALYVGCEAAVSMARMIRGYHRLFLRNVHTRVRSIALLTLLLAFLTSVAIFLGNGTTNIHANASGSLLLNRYAQALALIAGTMQLLVFFGSDRLFKSERSEAKSWQKHLQNFIAVSISLLLVFSMVHWMGRENISKFTDNRDPYFVRGDITGWDTVLLVMNSLAADDKATLKNDSKENSAAKKLRRNFDKSPSIVSQLPMVLKSESRWKDALAGRRIEILSSIDPKDLDSSTHLADDSVQPWLIGRRVVGAVYAYGFAMYGQDVESLRDTYPNIETTEPDKFIDEEKSVYRVVHRSFAVLKLLEEYQDALVMKWNDQLASSKFTAELIAKVRKGREAKPVPTDKWSALANLAIGPVRADAEMSLASSHAVVGPTSADSNSASSTPFSIGDELTKLLVEKDSPLTENHRKAVQEAIRCISSVKDGERVSKDNPYLTQQYALVNRLLLESMFPAAIKSMDIPSTLVVPPHDHRARCSWLAFWLVLTLVGSIAGAFRAQLATVFRFYRKQLGINFLRQSHNRKSFVGKVPMDKLRPTADGLPYPLMLAASLEPSTVNGSYKVRAVPFVFSPLRCGVEDNPLNVIESLQLSLKRGSNGSSISLGDAVTLSGAAVSPLMTGNRCLSVLVDFFNTGLGTFLYRTDRPKSNADERWKFDGPSAASYLVVALAALVFGLFCFLVIGKWTFAFVAYAAASLIGISLIHQLGTPHFLYMLFWPPELANTKAKARSSLSFYVADGGFCDYLGVSSLLRRRCELIVVSDAGANIGEDQLGTLARMCEQASSEMGICFLDLDHEAPIDFGRLQYNEQRLVHQPYLCMRIRYPDASEGLLIYCQMAITENDPIEIKQIRYRFPKFPDEPTVNQFYTDEQVAAYRSLGYHVANKMCRELERWNFDFQPQTELPEASQNAVGNSQDDRKVPLQNPLQKFSQALHNSRSTLGTKSVPYFDVIQERLLTAYRLACYEEISYNKDDIFSEAVWPISSYAFPHFGYQVDQLVEHANEPEQFASIWLRTFELSGDVRSAYRTAVVADINAMSIGSESFSERLWSEFLSRAKNRNLDAVQELFAAHLVVMATACQEIHRGRPHAAFQIGGRRKLIELCKGIARKLQPYFADGASSSGDDVQLRQKLDEIVAELTELERSIFQGGEHVTTISFTHCLAVMWGRMSRGSRTLSDVAPVAARARMLFEKKSGAGQTESRMVEARHELDRGLRETNMRCVIESMTKLWYLGFFGADGKDALNSNPVPSFAFYGFGELVKSLSVAGTKTAADDWVRFYKSKRELSTAYRNAVRLDIETMDFDGDCFTNDLFRVLLDRAKSLHASLPPARLIPAHLAAIAIACYEVGADDTPPRFLRARLSSWCAALPIKTQRTRGKDDPRLDEGLTTLVNRLFTFDSVIDKWTPSCSARFAKCFASFWGRMMRSERSIDWTHFPLEKAKELLASANPYLESASNAAPFPVQNEMQELQRLFQQNNCEKIVEQLKQIWYTAYLTKDDLNQLFIEPKHVATSKVVVGTQARKTPKRKAKTPK